MQTLSQDLRYAARMLLKQPGFTLVAILTRPAQQADFFHEVFERLDALPAVCGSTTVVGRPLTEKGGTMSYSVTGRPLPPVQDRPYARYGSVHPGYFGVLQIPLLGGRTFNERDRAVALLANLLPARRAMRISPVMALREE